MRRGEEGCGNFAQQEKSIQNISEIENNQNRTQKMQIIANGPPVFGKKKKKLFLQLLIKRKIFSRWSRSLDIISIF